MKMIEELTRGFVSKKVTIRFKTEPDGITTQKMTEGMVKSILIPTNSPGSARH